MPCTSYRSTALEEYQHSQPRLVLAGNVVVRVPIALLDEAKAGNAKATASLNAYKLMATRSRTDEQMGLLLPSNTFMGQNGPSAVPMYSYEYA